jgi:hypothetical protein
MQKLAVNVFFVTKGIIITQKTHVTDVTLPITTQRKIPHMLLHNFLPIVLFATPKRFGCHQHLNTILNTFQFIAEVTGESGTLV